MLRPYHIRRQHCIKGHGSPTKLVYRLQLCPGLYSMAAITVILPQTINHAQNYHQFAVFVTLCYTPNVVVLYDQQTLQISILCHISFYTNAD